MGDVIDTYTKAKYEGDVAIDPHEEISLTITKDEGRIIKHYIELLQETFDIDADDMVALDEFYWQMCNEMWPEEEGE